MIKFVLLLGFSCLSFAAELTAAPDFPELQWLHSSTDRLQHLSASPAECLDVSGTPEQLYPVEVGRQAFRSPALLGGQAARAGMSCQSCHINGHSHPAFFIEGLSGERGTVDVTTAVFSEVRGDAMHNPVAIPDLVNLRHKQSYGSVDPQASLSDFVRSLIVDEFAGEVPSSALLNGLVSYLQSLSSSACPAQAISLNNLDQQLFNILRSVDVIDQSYVRGEKALADFLILSAQHELSLLYQRFALEETAELAHKIVDMSRQLGDLRQAQPQYEKSYFLEKLHAWLDSWQQLSSALREQESRSLYWRQNLEIWLLAHP